MNTNDFLAAVPAAHEGHGHPAWESSPLHYLLEPEHAAPVALLLVAAIVITAQIRARWKKGSQPPAVG